MTPQQALNQLKEGNQRFVSGTPRSKAGDQDHRLTLAKGQHPFAVVLGCSDSRVPPEIVFDQGLGDLFVVRVAGNIATPSQIGSIEFAASHFGSSVVVVLGHTQCGAVITTLKEIDKPTQGLSPHLQSLVNGIRPAVSSGSKVLSGAVRENIRAAVKQLQSESQILGEKIQKGELVVLGAEYNLQTGAVDFLDATREGV